MGEVYRARDTRLDLDLAVKVLPAELSEDRNFKRLGLQCYLSSLAHAEMDETGSTAPSLR